MLKNRIAVITADKKISRGYKSQLEDIFDQNIEIVILDLEDTPEAFLGFNLILVGSEELYDLVKMKAPLNAKIITIIRNINTHALHKLFKIESGSAALVVGSYLRTAQETIDLLNELGINHIEYIPYCPNYQLDSHNTSSINFAITTGSSSFVPRGIKKVVDLGFKVIDISTVLEIIISLGLPPDRINLLTLRYMKEFIALNRKISDLKYWVIGVLDASSDGIMALDAEGNIIFKNNNLEMFLDVKKAISVGENISKYISNINMLDFMKSKDSRRSDVFKINKKDVMINKNKLKSIKKISGTVFSFRYVSEIQDIEKEIRKKLNNKGNVAKYDFKDIIGFSKSIKLATDMTRKSSRTDLAVLFMGENGTGKELFAQALHRNSARRNGPFLAVNFAALAENLIESELFGYEEGAFTGARKGGKPGLFELAHMGTIFLDEIGDAPLSLQARLLRVIQEKEVLRIGGAGPIPVDVRVISATNKNLKKLIEKNLFRTDLYYRLNTIVIKIPPLRERKEDIPYIIEYYMNNLNSKKMFSEEAMKVIYKHNWSGNVRELENLVNYAVEIVDGDIVDLNDLPLDMYGDEEAVDNHSEIKYDILEILSGTANLKLFAAVLEELQFAEGEYKRASRHFLFNKLSKKHIPVTDNILRRVLAKLAELDCVDIGSTKQGTRITGKGREILKRMKNEE
jgi:sigma-54 dependent transcriptional regulator, acetoin dehydrogenase operon transcriptional activator AcoR